MRIGIVCYPSYGGSGVIATELGKKLAARGHQIHFITYDRPFKLSNFHENIFFHEVEVLDYPLFKFPPYTIALASKIADIARWAELDLVHVHYALPHTVSAFLAKQMLKDRQLPIVTTLHGTDITVVGHEPQFFDITRFSIEESDIVTAVSHSLKADTARTFKTAKEIEVIHNFVSPEEYRRVPMSCLQEKYKKCGDKIFVHISNFRPVKRLQDVVDVFHLVNQKIPSRLLMVGDGPELPAVHRYIESLGIGDRVHFMGKQERVVEILSVSDICLLPSEKESFGLVALEAMACGVPVIASVAGGIPEVVTNGETGFLLPVGDVKGMADKAIEILETPHMWEQMSKLGQEIAAAKFSAERIVSEYEACYKRLL